MNGKFWRGIAWALAAVLITVVGFSMKQTHDNGLHLAGLTVKVDQIWSMLSGKYQLSERKIP